MGKRLPYVIGHRGSRGTHPENTLVSFREAIDVGVPVIELDVQFTKDEIPIVFHDAILSNKLCRLNGKKLPSPIEVASLTFAEIRKYDCGRSRHPDFPKQQVSRAQTPILSLDEFFDWARAEASDQTIMLELKMPPPEQTHHPAYPAFVSSVSDLISKHQIAPKIIAQSFDYRVTEHLQDKRPDLRFAHLFSLTQNFDEVAISRGACWVTPHFDLLTPKVVKNCQKHGIVVTPYTVNRPAQWRQCIKWKIDGIITDYPRRLSSFLKRK